MLDADGPGQLVGFVYGVRLIDQTDRWSHGGDNNSGWAFAFRAHAADGTPLLPRAK